MIGVGSTCKVRVADHRAEGKVYAVKIILDPIQKYKNDPHNAPKFRMINEQR